MLLLGLIKDEKKFNKIDNFCQCYLVFFFITDVGKKAWTICFCLVFNASQISVEWCSTHLLENIRLSEKNLPGANALA
jgi:hypothetical protein